MRTVKKMEVSHVVNSEQKREQNSKTESKTERE